MHIPLLQTKITTNMCSIMTRIVYGVVALVLRNALNDLFANTIPMNNRYFLAHNYETTAPIGFKFWYELVEMT